jgi:hypothetical protein
MADETEVARAHYALFAVFSAHCGRRARFDEALQWCSSTVSPGFSARMVVLGSAHPATKMSTLEANAFRNGTPLP